MSPVKGLLLFTFSPSPFPSPCLQTLKGFSCYLWALLTKRTCSADNAKITIIKNVCAYTFTILLLSNWKKPFKNSIQNIQIGLKKFKASISYFLDLLITTTVKLLDMVRR